MKIFSGSSNKPLAENIAEQLHLSLSPVDMFTFPDGEHRIRVTENVVDEHCIIVQSTSTPVDEHYMELFFLIDGLRRSGCSQITAVVPYFGYQRQDHVFRDGEAVSLEVIIRILESLKIDRLISFDMHSSRIPALFPDSITISHVSALPLFAEKIREIVHNKSEYRISKSKTNGNNQNPNNQNVLNFKNSNFGIASNLGFSASNFSHVVLVSPDMGGIRRIKQLSQFLGGMSWAAIEKNRDLSTGDLQESSIGEGSVKDKKIGIIVDDMIASGGTMVKASELLAKSGVSEVYVFATHPVFSSDASKKLNESRIKKVFVTDTIEIPEEKIFPGLEILPVGETIKKEIKKISI